MNSLISRIIYKLNKFAFLSFLKRSIPKLKQVKTSIEYPDVILVSQVHHAAIEMSIISLKAFMHHSKIHNIHVIDDGSLTAKDHQLLKEKFEMITIIPISSVDTTNCPTGGTWERLLYIAKLVKNNYVVQVDSDVLTIAPIFEVNEAIQNNTSFIISDGPIWNKKVPISLMSTSAKALKSSHIQDRAEEKLTCLTNSKLTHYIRGCSGFCGFAINPDLEDFIRDTSHQMEKLLGKEDWSRWGTEQLTSNIAISSYQEQIILPWPKYQNYGFPHYSNNLIDYHGKVSLIHFIGSTRHKDNNYLKLAKQFIDTVSNN